MSLICLTYVSFATKAMSTEEILDLLKVSKEKNEHKNITGMLLYRDRYFIQALEGEEADVIALYEKIKEDKRHRNVVQIDKEYIEKRSFGEWSMGFSNLDEIDPEKLDGFTDFLNNPVPEGFFKDNPSHATKLLNAFREKTWF